jgi:hypothetical protein
MADTQSAPQPQAPGSVREAQEALLGLMEPEEEKPKKEEATPTEEEESTEETQDESLEEESEEESEESEEVEEDDEEETEESDEEEEEELLYAVKVDGEEQEVSLDELLKGYSRQSDYTRKTQDLSTERKEMESLQEKYNSEMAQIQAERQQYTEYLNQIVESSMGGLDKYANIDWESMKASDPIEYVTKREEFREAQEKIQAMRNEQATAQQKQAEESKQLHAQMVQEEHKKLVSAEPDWGVPEKQKELAGTVRKYALSQGFSEEELNSLIDHRSVLVLMKAAKFDAMDHANIKAKKLKNKPKVIRAGKGRSSSGESKSKRTAQMKRLKESGNVRDASVLFEDFVELE